MWFAVGRFARVIAVDVPHHVTQRGNARRFILEADADRMVYLDLLRHHAQQQQLTLMGYCLMSNHVHLVVIPRKPEALAVAMKQTHGRYASYWNARHVSSGHAWQGRFYSCPLDDAHLWAALRYAELNPVRAGLVHEPETWPWSSAAAHCGSAQPDVALEMETWCKRSTFAAWREFLSEQDTEEENAAIRQCTHTGRPLGTPEFVEGLEKSMQRQLAPQKGGRPQKPVPDDKSQGMLVFDGE
jgi:putative transposase